MSSLFWVKIRENQDVSVPYSQANEEASDRLWKLYTVEVIFMQPNSETLHSSTTLWINKK